MPYYLGNIAGTKTGSDTRWEYETSISHDDPEFRLSPDQGGGIDHLKFSYAQLTKSRLILNSSRKTLGNFVDPKRSDGYLFSDRFRVQLESIDPGLHHYCEVPIFMANGTAWHEKYWFYSHYAIPSVDAIDVDRSAKWVAWKPFPTPIRGRTGMLNGVIASGDYDPPEVFLNPATIAGPNFFREGRTSLTWCFLSDRLVAALKAAKALAGIEHRYVGI